MARPEFDVSPDTGGDDNESSTETNIGVHHNSPPPDQIHYRGH